MTTMKLPRRLSFHLAYGSPKNHLIEKHGIKITRKILEDNTHILTTCSDERRLSILEALNIKENKPALNLQAEDLKPPPSFRSTNHAEASRTPQHLPTDVTNTQSETGSTQPPPNQSRVKTGTQASQLASQYSHNPDLHHFFHQSERNNSY